MQITAPSAIIKIFSQTAYPSPLNAARSSTDSLCSPTPERLASRRSLLGNFLPSLTSLALVNRSLFAGLTALIFLILLIFFHYSFLQLPIMLIMSCKKCIFRPYYFLNFRNLQPESIFVKGCFKILNKKIQIQSKSELTDILCICNIYSTGKSERRF